MDFKLRSETVEFTNADGEVIGSLTVRQATLSEDQRRAELEILAEEENALEVGAGDLSDSQHKRQNFRLNIYPKMAACATGDVPDEETAFNMPAQELYKWYDAAHKVNPEWFAAFDEIAEAYRKSKEAGKKKRPKSSQKRKRSGKG